MGISLIARIADGVSLTQLSQMMEARSEALYVAAGARTVLIASPAPMRTARVVAEQRRLLFVLLGAAVSLLLTACANAASLELAGALARARTYAIQLAVGASRTELVRTGLLEGMCLVGTAALAAAVLAYLGTDALVRYLPPSLTASVNPIDVDYRALLVTTGFAGLAWILSSLPLVAFAWRANLLELLKIEGASISASRAGALWRRALTVAQVALAVMLLVGSVLYVRSYLGLVRLDKGFDSSGVVAISLTIPPQLLGSGAERAAMAQTILERLRARPGVLGAFEGSPPPSTGDSPTSNDHIEVDGRPPMETNILVPRLWVDPDYFRVLGIPLVAGRMFEPGDPPTNVIITESLARRLWPDGDAVGHRFREDPLFEWSHVIGVVKHVRTTYDGTSGPERYFQKYSLRQPPPPATASTASTPRSSSGGAAYGFLTVTARVDSRSRASDLYQTVRSIDTRNILKVEFVDDQYARQFADRLLATRIITGFGVLAFVVAAAGIYGVMAFLVANRAREIGIRMALGADSRRIRRLVLESSMWLVLLGAAIGIGGAVVASRWAQSQLFGVRATDPMTIVLVTVAVVVTASASPRGIQRGRQPAWTRRYCCETDSSANVRGILGRGFEKDDRVEGARCRGALDTEREDPEHGDEHTDGRGSSNTSPGARGTDRVRTCSTSVRSERQRTALDGTFTANTNRWPSGLLTVLSWAGAPTGVGSSNSARGARASNAGLVVTSTAITVCRGGCDR